MIQTPVPCFLFHYFNLRRRYCSCDWSCSLSALRNIFADYFNLIVRWWKACAFRFHGTNLSTIYMTVHDTYDDVRDLLVMLSIIPLLYDWWRIFLAVHWVHCSRPLLPNVWLKCNCILLTLMSTIVNGFEKTGEIWFVIGERWRRMNILHKFEENEWNSPSARI